MKRLLTFLALCCLMVTGAWAQANLTSLTDLQDGIQVKIANKAHSGYYINLDATNAHYATTPTTFTLVGDNINGFKFYDAANSRYIGPTRGNGEQCSAVTSENEAGVFKMEVGSTGYFKIHCENPAVHTKGSVDATSEYLGWRNAGSMLVTWTYTVNSSDFLFTPVLDPLTFVSEIKDGATYAFINIQPTTPRKTYYLYSDGTTLSATSADACGADTEWATSAQFVAMKQSDGKYAFKNVANNKYLAYKTFTDNIDANLSAWSVNDATRFTPDIHTFWFGVNNRSSSDKASGSIILTNEGDFNNCSAAEFTANTSYSNTYGLVLVAEPATKTFDPNKLYTLHETEQGRGYMAYNPAATGMVGLADVTLSGYGNLHASTSNANTGIAFQIIEEPIGTVKFYCEKNSSYVALANNNNETAATWTTSATDAATFTFTKEGNNYLFQPTGSTLYLNPACGYKASEGPVRLGAKEDTSDWDVQEYVVPAAFVTTSTSESPAYYTIQNVRTKGKNDGANPAYVTAPSAGACMTQANAITDNAVWYFEDATADAPSTADLSLYQPVYILNKNYTGYLSCPRNNDYANASFTTTGSKQIFYLSLWTNGTNNDGYLCVTTEPRTTTQNTATERIAWADKNGNGAEINYYVTKDDGTSFLFAEYVAPVPPTSYTYDVTINANGANVSSLTIDETVCAEGEATFNHEIQESDVTVTPVGGYSYTLNITQPNGTEHGTIVLTYTMVGVDVAVPGTYYVYLKNRDSQGHETYLYSDHGNFPGQTQEKASITSAEKLANDLVWRLVSDGTNVTITNGQGFGYLPGDGAAEVKTVPVSNFNWITEKVTGYVQVVNINILYSKGNDYGINGTYQAWNGGFFLFASQQTSFMAGSGNDQDGEFQTVIPSNVAWWTITETDQTFRSPNLRYDANEDTDEVHLTYTYFYQYEADQTFILSGLIAEAFENMDKVGYYSSEDVEMNQEVMEMWMSTLLYPDECMEPDGYYEMLDTFNEFCLSHEVITPQPGQAFRMSVRTVDCTKQMYLTDEGTLTDDPAKAAIFVAGSSSDGEGYNKIFASNNNSKLLYLNNTGATEGDYTEGTCDFKLVPMNTISDENGWFGAYNDPAHRFGTFYLEANNYEEEYSDNDPKALMMKENGDDSYELITGVKGARMLTASDDPDGRIDAPYSTAVKLEEVEYPYTEPKLVSGTGDGHEGVWASVWLPFPMNIPDGIEVYKGTQERTVKGEPYLGLTKVDPDTHSCYAAGGYLLYSTTVSAGTIDVLPANSVPTDARVTDDAAFVGCTENPGVADDGTEWTAFSATFDGKTPYVLANKSNGVGFYKYVGTKMPKGKAIWLKPAASSDAECVKLGFDDIISAIEALHGNTTNAEIYDLQGHRLDKVEKGQINVINGQKIMFK